VKGGDYGPVVGTGGKEGLELGAADIRTGEDVIDTESGGEQKGWPCAAEPLLAAGAAESGALLKRTEYG